MAVSPERSRSPSVRFYCSTRNNIGAIMAILAGIYTIGASVWPILPSMANGELSPTFRIISVPVGIAYLAGFLLADRRWQLARLVLIGAALVQIVSALTLGRSYEAQSGMFGQLIGPFELLPAIVAIVAAFLIGPPPPRERA